MSTVEKRLGRLQTAIKLLGADLDLSTFESRLKLQKKVYLLQESGEDLGYSYGWYIHGPYSPGLTRDLFSLQELLHALKEKELDVEDQPTNREAFDTAKKLIHALETDREPLRQLELVSSLHFLIEHVYPKPNNPTEAIEELNASKPNFEKEEATRAFDLLRTSGLVRQFQ